MLRKILNSHWLKTSSRFGNQTRWFYLKLKKERTRNFFFFFKISREWVFERWTFVRPNFWWNFMSNSMLIHICNKDKSTSLKEEKPKLEKTIEIFKKINWKFKNIRNFSTNKIGIIIHIETIWVTWHCNKS